MNLFVTDLKICWLPAIGLGLLAYFGLYDTLFWALSFVTGTWALVVEFWWIWFPIAVWLMWETHKNDYS